MQACRSSSCLCELVYANDICLMASSTEHLQALLNALASCRALRHMEISVPKTKVMVAPLWCKLLTPSHAMAVTFNKWAFYVTWNYKCILWQCCSFHCTCQGCQLLRGVVQQRHAELQCGDTVNLS